MKNNKKQIFTKYIIQYHVLPHSKKGWAVKSSKIDRNEKLTKDRLEAISYAKNKARIINGEIIVHNKDGRIIERNSYYKLSDNKK